MEVKVEPVLAKKDYFVLTINGVLIGEYEKSELRYIMEKIDNAI